MRFCSRRVRRQNGSLAASCTRFSRGRSRRKARFAPQPSASPTSRSSRYLYGAKLTIPEIGVSAHVGGVACQSGHDRERFAVQEDIDLKSAGLKKGMTFLVSPDWSGATALIMEETP